MGKWERLLKINGWVSEYSSINKLLEHLKYHKHASEASRRTFGEILSGFCNHYDRTPDELAGLERNVAERLVQDYTDLVRERIRKKGSSVRYPNQILVCLKSFFRVNGFSREDGRELRLKRYPQPPRVTNTPEYIPSTAEAVKMAERIGSKRNRTIIYTLFSTGLRNSTLRALTYHDVKEELSKGVGNVCIKVYPEMKRRVQNACKNEIPYYVFTSKEATQAIMEMIQERIEKYGGIEDYEPLFISHYNLLPKHDRRKKFITDRELLDIVKKAARNAGLKEWRHVHVHTMRKVFERVLRSRLSDGGNLDTKDQEFLMGHILAGSQDNYYDRTKIEDMRTKYSKLVFTEQPASDASTRKFAKLLGIEFDKIVAQRKQELDRELTMLEEEFLLEESIRRSLNNKQDEYEQKVITEDLIENFLNNKWEFVASIGCGKILLRRIKSNNNTADGMQADPPEKPATNDDIKKSQRYMQTRFDREAESSNHKPKEQSSQFKDLLDSSKPQDTKNAATNGSDRNRYCSGTLDNWI